MRPTTAATTSTTTTVGAAGYHRWHSPMPYLFGGLALMLGLIALALVILACSYKNSSSSNSSSADGTGEARPIQVMQPDMEPKIVVIMAGDENPTYLAKPLSPS